MKIGVTGHRPDKLGGYQENNILKTQIVYEVLQLFNVLNPSVVNTGMALGFDQWIAEICIETAFPFVAYVPCEGQEATWPERSRQHYRKLLSKAKEIKLCSPGEYRPWKMHHRNKCIIQDSDQIIACWDGSPGGTASAVKAAEEVSNMVIHRIDPRKFVPA